MKFLPLLLFSLTAVIPLALCAQQKTDSLDVSDLYTPASTGFTLMDKAPTSVDKPTTTKAIEADILNLAQGAAVQVTPFWLKNHNNLKAEDFTKHTTPFFETLNFSLATVKTDSNYAIGLGFRTQLVRIYSFGATGSLRGKQQAMESLLADLGPAYARGDTAAVRLDTVRIDSISRDYAALIRRPVFVTEIAGGSVATTSSAPNSSIGQAHLARSGAWLNIRYSPFQLPLDFVGVVRYSTAGTRAVTSTRDSAFFDYGVGVFYGRGHFALSAEYLNRYDVSLQKSYDRLAAAVNYKISNQIIIVGAFGKNFDNVENLFTTLGVNFGLSKNTVQVAKPAVP
ncbi:hypothetical protein [Dinghuibacter silviterrae]|uniref:DUF3187 family protein n=1 Tax=Dinghuibacter silviterrae TaxID=1539049 RepID=A0A4R8DI69_9BACT|nr:hypothetical protein [Dinghuibacter silviterrae]TDW96650.1 hypothetical protein EDB95_4484 [Dinghuibacter silviterrae]